MARISDVLDTPKEQQGRAARRAGRLNGQIRAEHVSFRYSRLAPLVVDDVSLDIRPDRARLGSDGKERDHGASRSPVLSSSSRLHHYLSAGW